jgi:NodT family efflux transporter outer membrane factor (OMF) lipoprotein
VSADAAPIPRGAREARRPACRATGVGRALRALGLAVVAAALSACAKPHAPAWAPPSPPAPSSLVPVADPAADPKASAGVRFTGAEPPAVAWQLIGDARLERLIAEIRRSSPDMLAAAARVRSARALARRAALDRLPRLDADATGAFAHTAKDSVLVRQSAITLDVDATWELDLFDRLAHARDAAVLDAEALDEDRRALALSLESEAATAWFDGAEAAAEEIVLRETEALLVGTRDLLRARNEAGFGDELGLHRVEGDVATARAAVPEARLRAIQARHRLALLLGRPPDASVEAPSVELFPLPPELPVGLPAGLVRRRPDVRAAERRIEAEHARVQEAWAAFWPTVTLETRAGTSGVSLADVFNGTALFALFSPKLRVPVLDAGRLQAERLAVEADRDEAAARWLGVVLTAYAEVADATSGVALRRESLVRRRESVGAARKAVELANSRFESRLVGYLDVIESQRTLAAARLALVHGEHDLRIELVGLAKALGGGWDVEPVGWPGTCCPPAVPPPAFSATCAPQIAPAPSPAPATPAPAAPAPPLPTTPR